MVFNTKYARRPSVKEMNDGKTLTEKAGYIPAKIQIENMIQAGRRLSEYRKEQYDFGENEPVDDSFIDPTRNPGFDMADASTAKREVNRRLLKSKAEAERLKVEKEKAEREAREKIAPEKGA